MIRHIALFRLIAENPAQRRENVDGMRDRLQALIGVIPGLRTMTVELEAGFTPGNWDLALISEHDDAAAFAIYQAHPAHRAASVINDVFIVDRAGVDIEVDG